LSYIDLPVDDPTRRRPDIAKARTLLAWEPRVGLMEGLKESLPFFRSKLA
jgi:dTDP-glucose 4,6-dehydratase